MAAVKPEQMQDRHSRMVTSSVNAPVKKGGAGGAYTWGTAMSVTDYEPVGVGFQKVGVDAAQQPQGIVWTDRQAPPTITSDTFPALGSAAAPAVTWARVPDKVFQAPPAVTAAMTTPAPVSTITRTAAVGSTMATVPATTQTSTRTVLAAPATALPSQQTDQWMIVAHNKHGKMVATPEPVPDPEPFKGPLNANLLREGVPSLDAQHPRNTFARKPHHVAHTVPVAAEPPAMPAVDWSSTGTVALQSQVLSQAANPAHVSPYQAQARPAPTMQQLQARPPPPNTYVPKNIMQPKPQPPRVMQQPRK
mmetsp:Transcript_34954/g.81795  ORF Transcript_34954/g.81795 Transcript_34954/m.81795 type:complete len:306 (-) Transcript_34954:101-1018(-)